MANPGVIVYQVLVFTDQDGNMYAFPREVVEQHRLTPEQKSVLVDQISAHDVAHFDVQAQGGVGQSPESRKAEYIQEASALQETLSGGSSGEYAPQVPQSNLEGVMMGAWRTISRVDPQAP